MILPNLAYMESLHGPGRCEACGRRCKELEGHHVFTRATGIIDHPINVIRLGRSKTFQCYCHSKGQGGKANRDRFLAIIAKRENTTPASIEEVVYVIRRLPKDAGREEIERELNDLADGVRKLATRVLTEAGKL